MPSYARLKPLTQPTRSDLGNTFQRMAELLQDFGEKVIVQFHILDGPTPSLWSVKAGEKDTSHAVQSGKTERSDFEVVARAETWWKVAEGTLSPLEAFLQGQMRWRGNLDVAERLLRHLAASGERFDICKGGSEHG